MKCPKCNADISEDSHFCSKCGASLKTFKDVSVTKTLQKPTKGFKKDTVIAKKYKIIEKIGEGGMGVVYKAKDNRLDRTVALKFLPPELTRDEEAKKRFIQEAKAAAALNHPHICIIHEVDESDDQTFIAMEFIEGQTLKEKIETGPLSVEEAVGIASQVAEGLGEAHKKGIIHRDIKPANIMLTEKDQAKIMDFGLAKLSWGADLTKQSMVMGTVAYMSPEQARGEAVDQRTDIWSLGAMLYEMLTGERPFQKAQEQALIYAILNDKPTPLSLLRSDIPNHVEQVIKKALAKKAADRYQNMNDLISDLKESPPITYAKAEKSIVVLPFDDLSPDRDQEYFSDGLTEEVISDLSSIGALRVISRSSAMTFKATKKTAPEIARQLNVQYVLEGSVRKAGNNLRITAQLIDAARDTHLWAEKYRGTLDDVFDIQEKVSCSIADALKLRLSPEENRRISERPIKNVPAYELYLKAMSEIFKLTEDALIRAVRNIQNGINIIGENALLFSAMAWAYIQLGNIGAAQEETVTKAREYVEKALDMDPDCTQAHSALGFIFQAFLGNTQQSVYHFKKALTANPNEAEALGGLGISYVWYAGKTSAAVSLEEKLMRMDPLNPFTQYIHGGLPIFEGRFDDAVKVWHKFYEMDPENPPFQTFYAYTLALNNRLSDALQIIDSRIEGSPKNAFSKCALILKYALLKKKESVFQEITPDFQKTCKRDGSFSHLLAAMLSLLGAKKEALYWLENAAERGFINFPFLEEKDPFLENIRGEPRFKKLMERVKHEWENFEV